MLKILWTMWIGLTAAGTAWLLMALPDGERISSTSTIFLPGETTHGHYQIEMKCATCHLPDGGVSDQSCIDCHGADLKESRDTHPQSKFVDPTRAELVEKIDVTNCLTCHVEHQEELTSPMGVTLPVDFCFHCHEDIAKDRPSHAGMTFDSCATAGCHNYHDNTALYENFLRKHAAEPAILNEPVNPLRKLSQWLAEHGNQPDQALTMADADAPDDHRSGKLVSSWAESGHALVGVNCTACHAADSDGASSDKVGQWVTALGPEACENCHRQEVRQFYSGRHGMRLEAGLEPMTPAQARLPMHDTAAHKTLDCAACHDPHRADPNDAAVDACLSCHNDAHSQAYVGSSHHLLWQQELRGELAPGQGVSCATCHMPRDSEGRVQHNQNDNLRPSEKMLRTVCLNCHGLEFALDALADVELKDVCYARAPVEHVGSVQMVIDWFKSKEKRR